MLEAVHTDLVSTIGLKRSTQNLQLSTSSPADYPIFEGEERKWRGLAATSQFDHNVTSPTQIDGIAKTRTI
jgi:hypothetical protein